MPGATAVKPSEAEVVEMPHGAIGHARSLL
jgi:hypothetical protein